MNYAIEQRLRFIDFLLGEYGYINRSALIDFFGISTPQASSDIRAYLEMNPKSAKYNKNTKRYEASNFTRIWQ